MLFSRKIISPSQWLLCDSLLDRFLFYRSNHILMISICNIQVLITKITSQLLMESPFTFRRRRGGRMCISRTLRRIQYWLTVTHLGVLIHIQDSDESRRQARFIKRRNASVRQALMLLLNSGQSFEARLLSRGIRSKLASDFDSSHSYGTFFKFQYKRSNVPLHTYNRDPKTIVKCLCL